MAPSKFSLILVIWMLLKSTTSWISNLEILYMSLHFNRRTISFTRICYEEKHELKLYILFTERLSCTSWRGKHAIIYRVSYMLGGCLGFLPTVPMAMMTIWMTIPPPQQGIPCSLVNPRTADVRPCGLFIDPKLQSDLATKIGRLYYWASTTIKIMVDPISMIKTLKQWWLY